MLKLVGCVLEYRALIVGIGVRGAMIAQMIERAGLAVPYGIAPLAAGLVVGGLWGAHAQFRGRWI